VRFLTLFSGAGGSDIGIHAAGCESVGIEHDEHAVATARAAGHDVIHGDVRDLSLYPPGPFDAIWSSFPCQDWSSAGKREGSAGERNGWPWTVAALDHVRPRWFFGENVTGLIQHRGACKDGCVGLDYVEGGTPRPCPRFYFDRVILEQLQERFAWVGWRVLDAAAFGVPQFRKRVILVAGPRSIRWPQPTHGEPTTQTGLFGPGLLPWVTVRAALGLDCDLRKDRGAGMEARWGVRRLPADGPAPSVRSSGQGGVTTIGSGLKGSEWTVDRPSPVVRDGNGTAGVYIRTEATGAVATPDTEPAPAVGNQYLHAEDPGVRVSRAASQPGRLDRPADTLSAGSQSGHPNGRSIVSASQKARECLLGEMGRRRLTVAECSVLQNFPPDYPWQGTKTSQYRQVGNAVPPKLAEVVVRAVLRGAGAPQAVG
jgi:DNA (cytosine-5)-methyltransferase 1